MRKAAPGLARAAFLISGFANAHPGFRSSGANRSTSFRGTFGRAFALAGLRPEKTLPSSDGTARRAARPNGRPQRGQLAARLARTRARMGPRYQEVFFGWIGGLLPAFLAAIASASFLATISLGLGSAMWSSMCLANRVFSPPHPTPTTACQKAPQSLPQVPPFPVLDSPLAVSVNSLRKI